MPGMDSGEEPAACQRRGLGRASAIKRGGKRFETGETEKESRMGYGNGEYPVYPGDLRRGLADCWEALAAKGTDTEFLQYLDISLWLYIDGVKAERVTELPEDNPLTLTLTMPDEYLGEGRTFWIAMVHGNSARVLNGGDTGRNVRFVSREFSTYALGYSEEEVPFVQVTVTFDTNGGIPSEPITITGTPGDPVKKPADPSKEGYTFLKWDKTVEVIPEEDTTVTAQWKINQYTIVFDSNGGTAIAPITQDFGTAVTAPANPTRLNYAFTGWEPEIPSTMPAKNLTVKAKWKLTNGKGVNTGDDSNMPLWIVLLVLLAGGFVGFNVWRRKKHRD